MSMHICTRSLPAERQRRLHVLSSVLFTSILVVALVMGTSLPLRASAMPLTPTIFDLDLHAIDHFLAQTEIGRASCRERV